MPTFKTAKVVKHEIPSAKFHDLILETAEPFNFTPGQFVSLKVAEGQMRAYSIAGKVTSNQFGLLIDTTPGGLGSQFIEKLQLGDTVEFIGPVGNLKPHSEDGSTHLVFLGTGCGIAPLKAMIEQLLLEGTDKQLTLYFGLRFGSDIFWDQYFNNLSAQHPNFHFKLCLSKPDGSWQGACGHITDLLKADLTNGNQTSAYMCGNARMVEEATEILTTVGCPKQRIYAEAYG
jgi:CDP-4-dehydro-6-deoxyglucose reductase, E3